MLYIRIRKCTLIFCGFGMWQNGALITTLFLFAYNNAKGGILMPKPNSTQTKVIALAGSPNAGKSTVFNALTGLNQHTGNWTGKTVSNAVGRIKGQKGEYLLADIPGTYSLHSRSSEEELARDFLLFGGCDGIVCVCDTVTLERGLCMVLALREYTDKITVCLNMTDMASKKGIVYDTDVLKKLAGVDFVKCSAKKQKGLDEIVLKTEEMLNNEGKTAFKVNYPEEIETALRFITEPLEKLANDRINPRFTALNIICGDTEICSKIKGYAGCDYEVEPDVKCAVERAGKYLLECGITSDKAKELTVSALHATSENICLQAKISSGSPYGKKDRAADRILTGKYTAVPIMLAMLAVVFYLTLKGANYPSQLLSDMFFSFEDRLYLLLKSMKVHPFLCGMVVHGMYRTLAFVVSVMLPPMAIFFPLFALLEESGVLPRIAYNLDGAFSKCNTCGKQALTMCMGLGCNAAGVVGCRIIDSERERLTAILTNSLVPCNGRLPILVSIISMFLVYSSGNVGNELVPAVLLALFIVIGVAATMGMSYFLSVSILKGKHSSYVLELPSYKFPSVKNVFIRSFFDKTLSVLLRAVAVALPMGAVIWIMANVYVGDVSVLKHCTDFLNPFGKLMGMDGAIVMAFLLGLPANETVVPIIIMSYMGTSALSDMPLDGMKALFEANGWSAVTAVCVCLFTLFHFPCATTLMTVKKETASVKYTLLAAVLPTVLGIIVCFAVNGLWNIISAFL